MASSKERASSACLIGGSHEEVAQMRRDFMMERLLWDNGVQEVCR